MLNINKRKAPESPLQPLKIVEQECLGIKSENKNGRKANVHVVAKGRPFIFKLESTVNLSEHRIMANLVYDNDRSPVLVPASKPALEYKCHPFKERNVVALETKIFLLSSQHSALFRIKFFIEGNEHDCIYSEPIRVVSKKLQAAKFIEREVMHEKEIIGEEKPQETSKIGKKGISGASSSPALEILERIEKEQKRQTQLLDIALKKQNAIHPVSEMDFDGCFRQFLTSLNCVPTDERPTKIRKVMEANIMQHDVLRQFLEVCQSLTSFPVSYYTNIGPHEMVTADNASLEAQLFQELMMGSTDDLLHQ